MASCRDGVHRASEGSTAGLTASVCAPGKDVADGGTDSGMSGKDFKW